MTSEPTYRDLQQRRNIAWKETTPTLPDAARAPGPYRGRGAYPFCLPTAFADHNLLPSVRADALALFADLGIHWHDNVAGGPSNHLRDSQVQCANALFEMVAEPERIMR